MVLADVMDFYIEFLCKEVVRVTIGVAHKLKATTRSGGLFRASYRL